jgi:hypothetical protein
MNIFDEFQSQFQQLIISRHVWLQGWPLGATGSLDGIVDRYRYGCSINGCHALYVLVCTKLSQNVVERVLNGHLAVEWRMLRARLITQRNVKYKYD